MADQFVPTEEQVRNVIADLPFSTRRTETDRVVVHNFVTVYQKCIQALVRGQEKFYYSGTSSDFGGSSARTQANKVIKVLVIERTVEAMVAEGFLVQVPDVSWRDEKTVTIPGVPDILVRGHVYGDGGKNRWAIKTQLDGAVTVIRAKRLARQQSVTMKEARFALARALPLEFERIYRSLCADKGIDPGTPEPDAPEED